ncbi:gamma-crystallin 2-like [Lissotriton helveticus]
MDQITFFEDKNFAGRSFECSCDCRDLQAHLSRCNSIKVESGTWIIYERPNYLGYQYILSRGDYPDFQHWLGFNDSARSCHFVPTYKGPFKMKVFEREDFKGKAVEFTEDCPSVFDWYHQNDIHSCKVIEGHWVFYELPNYKGRQYFLRAGEYKRCTDWGAVNSDVGSFRRVMDVQ